MGWKFLLHLFGFFSGKNLKYKRPKVKQMNGKKKIKKKIKKYKHMLVSLWGSMKKLNSDQSAQPTQPLHHPPHHPKHQPPSSTPTTTPTTLNPSPPHYPFSYVSFPRSSTLKPLWWVNLPFTHRFQSNQPFFPSFNSRYLQSRARSHPHHGWTEGWWPHHPEYVTHPFFFWWFSRWERWI